MCACCCCYCCCCCCYYSRKRCCLIKPKLFMFEIRFVLKCSPQNGNARASSCTHTHTQAEKMQRESRKNGRDKERTTTKKHFERAHQREHYQYASVYVLCFLSTNTCTYAKQANTHGKCTWERESKNALFI